MARASNFCRKVLEDFDMIQDSASGDDSSVNWFDERVHRQG